jgi:hypothetical protein
MEFMGKHKYFELSEFIKSDVANKKGIDNTPSFEVVGHLEELVENILDPLRAAYGMPIRITSGYRCPALNSAVHGVTSSVHQLGYAADLQVGGSFNKFRDFTVEWLRKSGARFDQLLIESDRKTGAKWLHIGLKNNYGQQRCQIKVMEI